VGYAAVGVERDADYFDMALRHHGALRDLTV
jgi:hypothetical protein